MLHSVKEERDIIHSKISRRNYLLKHVTVEKISVTGIRGRRRKQQLNELKEATGYWKLKVEALAVAYRGGLGVQTRPPLPKFRSFDKVEPDCKLSRKCLVFLFQHPN